MEKQVQKRSRGLLIAKLLITVVVLVAMVAGLINNDLQSPILFRVCFVLIGITALLDGIEKYKRNETKWAMLNFVVFVFWCVFAFQITGW